MTRLFTEKPVNGVTEPSSGISQDVRGRCSGIHGEQFSTVTPSSGLAMETVRVPIKARLAGDVFQICRGGRWL